MPAVDDEKQPEFGDVETHAIVADTSDLSPHQFSAPDRHSALPCVPPLVSSLPPMRHATLWAATTFPSSHPPWLAYPRSPRCQLTYAMIISLPLAVCHTLSFSPASMMANQMIRRTTVYRLPPTNNDKSRRSPNRASRSVLCPGCGARRSGQRRRCRPRIPRGWRTTFAHHAAIQCPASPGEAASVLCPG